MHLVSPSEIDIFCCSMVFKKCRAIDDTDDQPSGESSKPVVLEDVDWDPPANCSFMEMLNDDIEGTFCTAVYMLACQICF